MGLCRHGNREQEAHNSRTRGEGSFKYWAPAAQISLEEAVWKSLRSQSAERVAEIKLAASNWQQAAVSTRHKAVSPRHQSR